MRVLLILNFFFLRKRQFAFDLSVIVISEVKLLAIYSHENMPRAVPVEQKEMEQSGSLGWCGFKMKLKNELGGAAILKTKEMLELMP